MHNVSFDLREEHWEPPASKRTWQHQKEFSKVMENLGGVQKLQNTMEKQEKNTTSQKYPNWGRGVGGQ